jgi:hypothetical protein
VATVSEFRGVFRLTQHLYPFTIEQYRYSNHGGCVRYELVILQNGVRKPTKIQEGDEIEIDLKKGEVRFFRPSLSQSIYCVRFGCPIGVKGVLIKFPIDNHDALIQEEAEDLATLISALTWFIAEPLPMRSCSCLRYLFTEGSSRTRLNVKLKDVVEVNILTGSVDLYKAGGLYQAGSPHIKIEPLGFFYSFMHDEVAGIVELVSALTDTRLDLLDEKQGVVRFECVPKAEPMVVKKEKEHVYEKPMSRKQKHRRKGDLASITPLPITRFFAA